MIPAGKVCRVKIAEAGQGFHERKDLIVDEGFPHHNPPVNILPSFLQHLFAPRTLFTAEVMAAAMMTGIIWFVQVVHYPLFQKIPGPAFPAYEAVHTVRTGWVVAPLMLVELGSALALLIVRLPSGGMAPAAIDPLHLAALGCLLLIWASTFFLQVPLHGRLLLSADSECLHRLVATNWIRTILWSVRMMLLIPLLPKVFQG
jgi:hypothetical protein